MTEPSPTPSLPVPRILHAALAGGALIVVGVLAVLREAAPPTGAVPASVLRYVLLGMGVVMVLAFRAVRGRVAPPTSPGNEGEWWRANLGFALVAWALAESLTLMAGIFFYLTGDPVALGVAAVGLALLWVARPGRLIAG
ncbi:MAG: hypothetical protein ACREMV_04735 [Gemmatimonadales bacterium]